MSLRVAEEVERYRAFVEHLRTSRATGLRDAVSLEAMSSYTGKNGMLSRDITFFTDEAFEVFSLLYDFEVRTFSVSSDRRGSNCLNAKGLGKASIIHCSRLLNQARGGLPGRGSNVV